MVYRVRTILTSGVSEWCGSAGNQTAMWKGGLGNHPGCEHASRKNLEFCRSDKLTLELSAGLSLSIRNMEVR